MAEYQSNFTGKEVDLAVYRLLHLAGAGVDENTTFGNISSDEGILNDYDTITKDGVSYSVIWKIAPTSSNTVYGVALSNLTGKLYQVTSVNKSYTLVALDANSDTKNTAGSSNSDNKLYLVGATSQTSYATTYSDSEAYVKEGDMNAKQFTAAEHGIIRYNATKDCIEFAFK